MIDFKAISSEAKEIVESYTFASNERGCDYTFANLFAWGCHEYAVVDGMLVIRYLTGEPCYLFPVGDGDAEGVLLKIARDAKERGVRLVIKGADSTEAELIKRAFGDKVGVSVCRACSDYIYAIEDIASLKGKKYHGKRGHLAKFIKEFPSYKVSGISSYTIPLIRDFLDEWYASREEERSFELEREAIMRLITNKNELCAEGLVITEGERVLAFTVGSRSRWDTFDVHFEKASPTAPTAYTAINVEFSRHIRAKYPEVVYLNREDDMGIEGLRRAKESWYPCRMIEKHTASEVL